jgi:hypothetical protein
MRTVRVEVQTADGQTDSDEVTIQIFRDYDGDRMPNDWEQENGLNPLNLMDAVEDPDNDLLSNLEEFRNGTDPHVADTDGDGATDSEEQQAETDPNDGSSVPPSGPVLRVGAESSHFAAGEGDEPSDPRVFWITNPGRGSLSWAAINDIPWLSVEPMEGVAPTEVFVTALPEGLAPGTYSGDVIFEAAGAVETLRVTLLVTEPPDTPSERVFVRADSNGSFAVDIADAIFTLSYLFADGAAPSCLDTADANDDGAVDIADAIAVLSYLFARSGSLPEPFGQCGIDPTGDELGCLEYGPCEE